MEMNDETLYKVAEAIDNFFNEIVTENNLSLGAFNGMFMARMARMNEAYENMDNFKKLLQTIVDDKLEDDEVVLQ